MKLSGLFVKSAIGALVLGALGFSDLAFASWSVPVDGSDVATRWDALYTFLVVLSTVFFVGLMGAAILFAFQYHHTKGTKPKYLTGSHALEAIWVAVPTILLLWIFAWGYSVYHSMTQAPSNSMEVKVIAQQWRWQFLYEDGRASDHLYVPVNQPVKLVMSSTDVLHSMFIPAFRIKQDTVPGMYTSVWFEPKVLGKHHIFCTEYCGAAHSGMVSKAVVLSPEQWKEFKAGKEFQESDFPLIGVDLAAGENPVTAVAAHPAKGVGSTVSLADRGKSLFQNKGCVACHSTDGSAKIGPTMKGLFGHGVELVDGSKVKADENYLRESIEKPQAKLVKGFQPVMPTFQGQIDEKDMSALIAYIKSLD